MKHYLIAVSDLNSLVYVEASSANEAKSILLGDLDPYGDNESRIESVYEIAEPNLKVVSFEV